MDESGFEVAVAVQSLLQGSVLEILKLIAFPLGAALIIGLLIAIFQATTSIQEQTLTFLPKLVVILLVIALLGSFMFSDLSQYTKNLFENISIIEATMPE